MERFLKNIRGSVFWKRVYAGTMILLVLATLLPSGLQFAWPADNMNLLDSSTSITTTQITLGAKYKDENGEECAVELNQSETIKIPYDADISMYLGFLLQDGNAVDGNTVYTYKLPDTVRVDVDAWHPLSSPSGEEIGKVHIKKDGTLDFQFDSKVVAGHNGIGFYVQFEGNFSSDKQKEGEKFDINFPASDGNYTYHIETLPSSDSTETEEPKDIGISKSGNAVTIGGKQYIEWQVYLNPNGRSGIDGSIIDELPAGLTYVESNGYPRIKENDYNPVYGTVTGSASEDGKVTLDLSGTGSQGITVLFLTSIDADGSLYGGKVEDKYYSVNNEVIFNPDDTTDKSVSGDTTMWIKPNMVSKSAGASQIQVDEEGKFYIDWTVTLNADQLDLNGATYTDTIGEGLDSPTNIKVDPNKGNLETTTNGFQIAFTESTTETITVTYRTYVSGDSPQHGSYKNTAELTGDNLGPFKKEVSVEGLHLLDKSIGYRDYDPVTKLFTWTITVNQDQRTLTNVKVTDTFNSDEMEFIDADVQYTKNSDGTVTFDLGNIKEQKVIHVKTRMRDSFSPLNAWHDFENTATLTSDTYPDVTITDTAVKTVDTKAEVPDFVSKKGTMNGDGTISWQVDITHISNNVNNMDFKDTLPAGMDYVKGSFYLTNSWGGDKVYRTPTVSGGDLSYAITRAKDSGYMDDTNGFHIYYQTRLLDAKQSDVEGTFTNHAVLKLNFDNNISVEDEAEATVTGKPGGVLDKTFTYQGGREVTWTVKINAGRYALNATDPMIEDQLPDYMNYKSGALYLVKEDGSRQEVAKDAYSIISVNRKLMVQMPDITNECYEFQFVTVFNPMFDTALKNETIQNTVSFHGRAQDYTTTSNTVQNVEFGSSSAGAVINQEIRIKKVDAGDTSKVLPGAVFQLKLNGMVVGTAESDESGYAVFRNVYTNSGCTFELVEVTAPSGYVKLEDPVEIPFDGTIAFKTEEGVQYIEITVENENANKKTTGSVTVYKVDAADHTQKLAGAVFGIYSDSTCTDANLIGQMAATDKNGMSTYAGLEKGTYYLKEITSPEGYVAGTKVIEARLAQDGNKVTTKYYNGGIEETNAEFENQKIVGTLTITKTDADTNQPVSDATFGLYSDALCTDLITSMTTDGTGKAVFTDLVPGTTYYYREDTAPPNYVKDSTIHSVKVGNGNEHENVSVSRDVTNQKAVGNIVITKRGDDGKLLKGVEFTLYDSTGTTPIKKNGVNYVVATDENGIARFEGVDFGSYTIKETKGLDAYIVSNDTSVTVNKLGDTEVTIVNQAKKVRIQVVKKDENGSTVLPGAIFELRAGDMRIATAETNEAGIADFGVIGYGTYQIVETKAPYGYNKSDTPITVEPSDFDTAIRAVAGTTTEPLITKNATNKKQNGSILLYKHDQDGNNLAEATFTLYDSLKQYVAKMETAANGEIKFENLPYGTYYIQETKAPAGYIRDTGYYRVEVNSDAQVIGYYDADNYFKTDAFVNTKMNAPYISFKLRKVDDSGQALSGATFGFYEITDLGVRNEIATVVTDEYGIAYFHRIRIVDCGENSSFEVKEINAPAGYVPDGTFLATFANKDALSNFADGNDSGGTLSPEQTPYIYNNEDDSTVTNREIKGSILLTKQGVTGLELLAGAQFTLYDKEGNQVRITGNPATTGANGQLRFENVPYGSYVIRETKAPKGYTLNPTPISVDITSENEVVLPAVRDNRISLSISKRAVGGATEIPGAKLKLTVDSGGALIDQWTSGTTAHSVDYSKLEVGKTYRLSETAAPNGYAYASDITFTIKNNGELQILSGGGSINGKTVIMRDEALQLSVRKLDETNADLPNAILAFCDGAGNELERWTTDGGAHAIDCSKISVPASGYKEYILREISAPTGYETAASKRIAVDRNGEFYQVTDSDTYTPLTDATITMTDKKKPSGTFYIRKIDTGTGLPLAEAGFKIVDAEGAPLQDQDGNLLDGDMWEWTSTDTPHAINAGQLVSDNAGSVYELVETQAPSGYTVAEPIRFRVVTEGGKLKIKYVSGDASAINNAKDTFTIKDTTLSLSIRKRNEFGQNLSGAVLRLSEYNTQTGQIGKRVEQFTSSTSDRVIDPAKLKTGQSYILQEIRTPEGYQKAEDIIFTIHPDATIESNGSHVAGNIVIMEDVSNGVVINKYNENMEYLPGSELELTSVDDLTFTTKHWTTTEEAKVWDMVYFKPGCTYTLTECSPPLGYAYAEPMTIRISEDGRKISVNGVEQDNRVVNMVDQKINLFISKQDITNQKELSGAKLEIKDETGTVIYSFISGEQPTQIPNDVLEVGEPGHYKTYTLTEITAPYGYEMAEDIQFAIDSEGSIYTVTEDKAGKVVYTKLSNNTVTMFDEPGYTISKQDVAGKEVPGATLTITAKNDSDFQPITWISEDRPKYFEHDTFTPGITYILTETNAPNGYAYAETIEFSIDKDGNVLVNGKLVENKQVVMVDDAITVSISKQDMTNGTELQGAELVIKNEAGEVIYSFVSTSEPTLIPAEVFTAPKPGSYSYYSLTEITAPEGYLVAETIYFAIDSTGQIYVRNEQGEYVLLTEDAIVMQDKPDSTDSSHSLVSGALKTGDTMRLNLIILLGLISLFTGCILLERSIFKK